MLTAVRAELLRHFPGQQDSQWRVKGSGRVREDFMSRSGAGALDVKQVHSLMRLINMKEESYLGSPCMICTQWQCGH